MGKPRTLSVNYRYSAKIQRVAQAVLERMVRAFPRSADKVDDTSPDEGKITPAFVKGREQVMQVLRQHKGCVVLCRDPNHKEVMELTEELAAIAIAQSKGLEFESVVILNFLSQSELKRRAWNVHVAGEERPKEDPPEELEAELKLLFVAIGRCSQRLIFAETAADDGIVKVMQKWLKGEGLVVDHEEWSGEEEDAEVDVALSRRQTFQQLARGLSGEEDPQRREAILGEMAKLLRLSGRADLESRARTQLDAERVLRQREVGATSHEAVSCLVQACMEAGLGGLGRQLLANASVGAAGGQCQCGCSRSS